MTKDDLMKFCNPRKIRISVPWSDGEYSYATNGHIIVRVPRVASIKEREWPRVDNLFPYDNPPAWFSVSDIKLPEVQTADCSTCNGDGIIEHDDCLDCGGHDCVDCGGTGTIVAIQPVLIGNSYFKLALLSILGDLPNCKIGPATEPLKQAPFQFDGGDGLIMPMRETSAWRHC